MLAPHEGLKRASLGRYCEVYASAMGRTCSEIFLTCTSSPRAENLSGWTGHKQKGATWRLGVTRGQTRTCEWRRKGPQSSWVAWASPCPRRHLRRQLVRSRTRWNPQKCRLGSVREHMLPADRRATWHAVPVTLPALKSRLTDVDMRVRRGLGRYIPAFQFPLPWSCCLLATSALRFSEPLRMDVMLACCHSPPPPLL